MLRALLLFWLHCLVSREILILNQLALIFSSTENRYSAYGTGQDDDEGKDIGCGGDGGESDQWYLGKTQCFRANSAFSLYGVLKDSSAETKDGSMCHKGTFINSFFTTLGVEVITSAFGIEVAADDDNGNYPSSYCTSVGDDNAGDDNAGDDNAGDDNAGDDNAGDDNADDANGEEEKRDGWVDYSSYTSYGTGCKKKQFVLDQYNGAFCNGHNVSTTLDTFDSFNSNLESMGCTQIFYGNGNMNDGRKMRKLEENDVPGILYYSRACSPLLYPEECPDPYGLVKQYERKLNRALQTKTPTHTVYSATGRAMSAFSWIFLIAGLVLAFLSYHVYKNTSERSMKQTDTDEDEDLTQPAIFVKQISKAISETSRSVRDAIQDYAEAEEEDVPSPIQEDVPSPIQESAPHTEEPPSQKKKRPRLAKFSKKLFGARKNKT